MRWNCYKLRQLILLQSAIDCYYKLRQLFYYKVRHSLLQIATGVTKCDGFLTNCDRYYKVRWLLQIATVQERRSLKYRYTKICLHLLWILKTLMFYRLFLEWGNVKEGGALKFPLLGKGWEFKKKTLWSTMCIFLHRTLFSRVFYYFYSDLHFIAACVRFLHPISRFK